jgi:CRP-like cAMP-binding protein
MEKDYLIERLRENPWFQGLGEEHFRIFVDIASEAGWREGETIFAEGDHDEQLYMITEGRVALEMFVPGQGRVTILTLGPNEIFGWSAVIPVVRTRTAAARAVTEARGIAFDSQRLREACKADHDLGFHVYRRLTNIIAARLTATRLQLLDMYAGAGR